MEQTESVSDVMCDECAIAHALKGLCNSALFALVGAIAQLTMERAMRFICAKSAPSIPFPASDKSAR